MINDVNRIKKENDTSIFIKYNFGYAFMVYDCMPTKR